MAFHLDKRIVASSAHDSQAVPQLCQGYAQGVTGFIPPTLAHALFVYHQNQTKLQMIGKRQQQQRRAHLPGQLEVVLAVNVDSANQGLDNVTQDLRGCHLSVAKGSLAGPLQGCSLGIIIC